MSKDVRRRGPPFTIRQVRGASYPPLTAPPSSRGGGGRASSAAISSAAPPTLKAAAPAPPVMAHCKGPRRSSSSPAPTRAPTPTPVLAPAPAPASTSGMQLSSSSSGLGGAAVPQSREAQRLELFNKLLSVDVVDRAKLRSSSWSGIPPPHRPVCWQLLLGYLPGNAEYRADTLSRKRVSESEVPCGVLHNPASAASAARKLVAASGACRSSHPI